MANSTQGEESQNRHTRKRQPAFPCVFCKGAHFNDNCDKFTKVVERKHQLTSQGRCFVCLKTGHFLKECPTAHSKFCYYCKRIGHHHRSLCPKQFNGVTQSSETTATNQSSTVNNQLPINKATNQSSTDENQADVTETTTNTVTPAVNTEHMLLTNGERVLLQTAVVPVYCANGSIVQLVFY